MRATASFKRLTCHGTYDGSLTVEVASSEAFELVWDHQRVNGDEDRIRTCLENGAREAFAHVGSDGRYRVVVTDVLDHHGNSPPATFQICIKDAVIKALDGRRDDGT